MAQAQGPTRCLLFKKIDSTLRGHLGAELNALLAVPGLFSAAVVCPALPDQGRTLQCGVLHVHGEVQRNASGYPLHLCDLLQSAGAPALWIDTTHAPAPCQLARMLAAAIAAEARVLVVDARDTADLKRLALALRLLSSHRILAVGAAGLAKALGCELFAYGRHPIGASLQLPPVSAGPVVGVVGSFSPASVAQVREMAGDACVDVVRLPAGVWLDPAAAPTVAAAVGHARALADDGRSVVFTAAGAPAAGSTRALVRAMAGAAGDIIRQASTLVLTGGDTARTVLDQLGIERLDVFGEVEPGICVSRGTGRHSPCVVTKAGGFGDAGALLRVMRRFEKLRAANCLIGEHV
jgi:uncharacterized protein YgbK (DUF1537 family)